MLLSVVVSDVGALALLLGDEFDAARIDGDGLTGADLSLEHIELLDGRRLSGFVESQDDCWVYLAELRRPVGRPMFIVVRPVSRDIIFAIDRLEGSARKRLELIVQRFRSRARIEAGRLDVVGLKPGKRGDLSVQRYRGKWFSLDTTADEATTRRLIVRVEQIFAAYRQVIAPRTEPTRPLSILVFDSVEPYRAYLRQRTLRLAASAVYLRTDNLVLAGSPLGRYVREMQRLRAAHDALRAQIESLEEQMETRLRRLGLRLQQEGHRRSDISQLILREKRRIQQSLEEKRNELQKSDRENNHAFDTVTAQMFQRLGHEAFHAYLENYVFPHDQYDVPIWLNEGLATTFETGVLDSGLLRVDAPHAKFLPRLQEALGDGNAMPLARLLRADPGDFLDPDHRSEAERFYAFAWGLAYYLAFEDNALRGPRLEEYATRDAGDADPLAKFERFVGQSLPEFESRWRSRMLELKN